MNSQRTKGSVLLTESIQTEGYCGAGSRVVVGLDAGLALGPHHGEFVREE